MTSSFFKNTSPFSVLLYKCHLIVFLVLFPVLIGSSSADFYAVGSKSKNFEISYYALKRIFLDIDSGHDKASRLKGIKAQKAGLNLLHVTSIRHDDPGFQKYTRYYPVDPERFDDYSTKANVLLLDLPPPSNPV
jgi:hypothetical protein